MKIEKLNEDKIRITLNLDDLKEKDIDFHTFMSNSIESQEIFLDMLNEAEEKVGFVTDDYRVMIEALAMSDGNFILTVTRLTPPEKEKTSTYKRKKVNIKRKSPNINKNKTIYCFKNFDNFCEFCTCLNNIGYKSGIAKTIKLYEYNDAYYLVLTNIDSNSQFTKSFCSLITEFAQFVNNSSLFECKLIEYGKLIMKNNALKTCIKHFVH